MGDWIIHLTIYSLTEYLNQHLKFKLSEIYGYIQKTERLRVYSYRARTDRLHIWGKWYGRGSLKYQGSNRTVFGNFKGKWKSHSPGCWRGSYYVIHNSRLNSHRIIIEMYVQSPTYQSHIGSINQLHLSAATGSNIDVAPIFKSQ